MELNQILNDMAGGGNPAGDNCDYGCTCGPENYGYYPSCTPNPSPGMSGGLGNNNTLLILILLLSSGNGFNGFLKGGNKGFLLILLLLLGNR
ncbi:hypothetical protein [Clostridium tarantellae]|uniref:Uncharacterized protein n=1 Tax=Clostridium tarantellae TaxID=39493 RepID=A0A6I1MKC2_9CLOT|nr:hypothetical protein [Clostridium tarantellae]MPQ43976.1 hypothetical protein [Clostridium tarantellae]